jgi:transketolase
MTAPRITDPIALGELAREIRKSVIASLAESGSGHLGGSLGLADLFTTLYFSIISHDPAKPEWEDRDRVILSIGHVAPVLYATLAHAGYFPTEELATLRKLGSRLQGHPGRDHGLPGLELSAGSLGQGLSVAVGMALAARLVDKKHTVYSIHGDGELQEGSVWEAAMAAAHHRLGNMVAIVDRNNLQIDGPTESVMALEPLADKWRSFGWNVINCNGNSIPELQSALSPRNRQATRPTVILAQTVMGCGVKRIEGDYRWHGKAPSREEAILFTKEIEEHTHTKPGK